MITGDVKFDQAQYAAAAGIALIDAGHYGTEKIFSENFADQLRKLAPEITVKESAVNANPYVL
jgi:putative NIF3 family GTP cyclohydrolase 1 type 2